ncbi:hypothetical protein P691DRAFT_810229 [Macrolepiota fuliginosa MF-IS2]|uniref:Uncharacterized protein n=1 Tax=Macrolepiota fuliginosa MF-IS2 TaxID=1400762 RepID=A0A9P5X3S9_9AGAR|nr:hypothetical protein P691DRAFT_810229 [Macrolepiota fuliginosa MF-IS2]
MSTPIRRAGIHTQGAGDRGLWRWCSTRRFVEVTWISKDYYWRRVLQEHQASSTIVAMCTIVPARKSIFFQLLLSFALYSQKVLCI